MTLLVAAALAAVLVFTAQMVRAQSRNRASAEIERRAPRLRQPAREPRRPRRWHRRCWSPSCRCSGRTSPTRASPATTPPIDAMVDGYRRELAADFSIVSDASGRWLASPGWSGGRRCAAPAELAGAIQPGASRHEHPRAGGRTTVVPLVSVPARFADEILGTLWSATV